MRRRALDFLLLPEQSSAATSIAQMHVNRFAHAHRSSGNIDFRVPRMLPTSRRPRSRPVHERRYRPPIREMHLQAHGCIRFAWRTICPIWENKYILLVLRGKTFRIFLPLEIHLNPSLKGLDHFRILRVSL